MQHSAMALTELPDMIRGFGPVKDANRAKAAGGPAGADGRDAGRAGAGFGGCRGGRSSTPT